MIARVAVWEPMPTDDRDWIIDAIAGIPGVRATYHLLDPETGNGLSIAIFDNETAGQAAGAAIRVALRRSGGTTNPVRATPRKPSIRCSGAIPRDAPWAVIAKQP